MKKIVLVLAILCCAVALAFASGGSQSSGAAQYKDTIIYAVNGDQDYMDPHMNVTNDKVIPWVYQGLLGRNMDNKIVGNVAESWSVGPDEKTWTFKLRKNMKFHNGKLLTAKDVKATYDRLLNKDQPFRYTSTYSYISEVKVINDYEVQIITSAPIGPFEGLMSGGSSSILDADYIAKYGRSLGTTPETTNGTGPYKLIEWKKDEHMKFEAFPDYVGSTFSGPPKTKYLIMQVIPEQNSRAIAAETGQVDIADGITPDDVARLQKTPGIKVEIVPARGMHLFQFNTAMKPMEDPRIRQAICYAVDKVTMVDTLFASLGEKPVTNPVSSMAFGYHDLGVFPYDVAKAKALMTEAGYPNGFDIKIMTTAVYNQGVAQAEIIAEYLKKAGLNPSIEVVESAVFNASLGGGREKMKWHIFIMGSGSASLDADSYLRRIFHTENNRETNVNNYGFYSNKEYDVLVDEAYQTTNVEKRLANYKRAEQIAYLEDPVGMFVNYRTNTFVMNDKVEGFLSNCNNVSDLPNVRAKK
jgi:peptide/nickel transport system substrate-binding protein